MACAIHVNCQDPNCSGAIRTVSPFPADNDGRTVLHAPPLDVEADRIAAKLEADKAAWDALAAKLEADMGARGEAEGHEIADEGLRFVEEVFATMSDVVRKLEADSAARLGVLRDIADGIQDLVHAIERATTKPTTEG